MSATAGAVLVAGERSVARYTADADGTWSTAGALELPARIMAITPAPPSSAAGLYAMCSAEDGQVISVGFDGGRPRVLGAIATAGVLPCSGAVSSDGRFLAVANYRSGTVGVHPIGADGLPGPAVSLAEYRGGGPDPHRQEAPHVHCVLPIGSTGLLAVDLGADLLHRHEWDPETGVLSAPVEVATARGAGPRHAIIVRDRWIVTADELGATASLFRLDAIADVTPHTDRLQLPLIPGDARDYPSDLVAVGDSVYVATRGADVITQLAIRGDRLVAIDEVPSGRWPLKLALVGSTLLCASRDDDAVFQWSIDPENGRLRDRREVIQVERPVWVSTAP